ncbi:MAG: hypothetical protein WDN69_03575 [Aliidongia sp.]
MAVYWISFRIEADGKGDERQFALTKAIHGYKRRYWDRTPGFILSKAAIPWTSWSMLSGRRSIWRATCS